ncbi:MAG: hypothetical protein AAFY15_08805 [Cyanobacteria bacterium J06648_11]
MSEMQPNMEILNRLRARLEEEGFDVVPYANAPHTYNVTRQGQPHGWFNWHPYTEQWCGSQGWLNVLLVELYSEETRCLSL